MNQLLMIIGVFVFFISVYGAVIVGGHLLTELEQDADVAGPDPGDHLDADTAIVPPAEVRDLEAMSDQRSTMNEITTTVDDERPTTAQTKERAPS
jgi:hypothetical protein